MNTFTDKQQLQTAEKETKGKRLETIETLRGVAALFVCLGHLTTANLPYTGSSVFIRDFVQNLVIYWRGVPSFFVISGFIIPYALLAAGYRLSDFLRFFKKRCLRIEPPYLVSMVFVLFISYLAAKAPGYAGEPFQLNSWQLLLHIGYLPEHFGHYWLIDPYWTLEVEFHFYILIGLLLPLLSKNKYYFIILLFLGLVASHFSSLRVFEYMPYFVFGITACLYKLKKIKAPLYIILLLSALLTNVVNNEEIELTGILTALLIVHTTLKSRITAFLGKISFSLYLLHVPVGSKLLNLLGRYTTESWQVWLAYFFALGVCILAAYIFYRLVEAPSLKWSKSVVYRHRQKKPETAFS